MHLCRVDLRPTDAARVELPKLMRSAYGVHQFLWRLFSDGPERKRDFLFRVDEDAELDPRESLFRAWTLSERPPVDLSGLFKLQTKVLSPALEAGNRLRFAVRVNPTVRRGESSRTHKARHDVVQDARTRLAAAGAVVPPVADLVQDETLKWLVRKGGDGGFIVETPTLRCDGYRQHRFRKSGGPEVRLSTIDVDGVLEVTDPARFVQLWSRGLGPAKGFGCGLMMIRRA
jgi:CRISPR system Cascade subunit CasE